MDLLKVILRKSLSPMRSETEDGSFYITFADDNKYVGIIDHYDRIEVSLLDKWHEYRSAFKKDEYVDGYIVDLCVPKESGPTNKFIADIIKAVNEKEKTKYDDYDFTVVFYNIADKHIKKFVKRNMKQTNQKMVEKYYDWVNGAIQDQVDKAKEECKIQPHCGCAVYLSFGSSEAVAVYYVKRDTGKKEAINNLIKTIRKQVVASSGFLEQRILIINKDADAENAVEFYAGDNEDIDKSNNEKDDMSKISSDLGKCTQDFNDVYEVLADGDHKAHRRVQNAMNDIMNIYNQISQSEHSHDIVSTLGAFLRCFLSSLTKIIENINSGKDGIACEAMYKNDGDAVNINEYSSFVEGSICAVRDVLSPLWHSEHAFYDDQRVIRHAVGGLIKLLYAYNDMLYAWNKIYDEENKKDPILNFATSGGVDIIANLDFFNYNHDILKDNDGPIERPIAVTVPEASLWDITGSIYRIAHEFFHVRGEKCRNDRAGLYLDGLCDVFAEYCYDTIIEEVLRIKAKNLYDNLITLTELKSVYSDLGEREAFEKFLEDVESDKNIVLENERFAQTLSAIRKSLSELREKLRQDIDKKIVGKYIERVVEYLKYVCKNDLKNDFALIKGSKLSDLRYNAAVLLTKALEITAIGIDNDVSGNLADSRTGKVDNEKLMTEVARAIKAIDGGADVPCALYDLVSYRTSVKPHIATIYKQAIVNYFNNDGSSAQKARYLIEKVMPGLYKECFADCLAIMSSGLNEAGNGFIRYILCMLYEKRSLAEYFYDSSSRYDLFMVLRLGIVKDVCGLEYDENSAEEYIHEFYLNIMFPHDGKKSQEEEKKAKREAARYARELNERIREINKIYIDYKDEGFIDKLKDYLKLCKDKNKKKYDKIKNSIGYNCKDIENEINGNEYAYFAFAHWLRLYGDRK